MKKETIIAIIALVLIAGIVGYYYYFMPKTSQQKTISQNLTPEQKADQAANPFSVKVNPFDGYKNPFDK